MAAPVPPTLPAVWTEADFDGMSWHDATVHAIAVEPAAEDPGQLLLDLDYLVAWVPPTGDRTEFGFWIAPTTLVFDQAWDLTVDVALHGMALDLQLDGIRRAEDQPFGRSTWTLEGHSFTLTVTSQGFRQHPRSAPIWSTMQRLDLATRGGISLGQQGWTAAPR